MINKSAVFCESFVTYQISNGFKLTQDDEVKSKYTQKKRYFLERERQYQKKI